MKCDTCQTSVVPVRLLQKEQSGTGIDVFGCPKSDITELVVAVCWICNRIWPAVQD